MVRANALSASDHTRTVLFSEPVTAIRVSAFDHCSVHARVDHQRRSIIQPCLRRWRFAPCPGAAESAKVRRQAGAETMDQ
jgi:hypothetical protein